MSRHAAPLSEYSVEDRASRLHAEMLADSVSHLEALATSWSEPDGKPYQIGLGTGTLPAIVAGIPPAIVTGDVG